jgi:hypothetical protein
LLPNQALPEGIPFAEGIPSEGTSSACPEECITRSVILNINERGSNLHGVLWV